MTMDPFRRWATTVRGALKELATQKFAYPLGMNELRPPAPQPTGVPSELEPLYEVCDGLNAPDVHVGYFLDSAARVCSARERGEPTRIEGEQVLPITVFGSDGGGSRFALCHADNSVLYLPISGLVEQGAYYESSAVHTRQVGVSLIGFLERLASDISAFGADKTPYKYLVDPDRTGDAG